MRRGQTVGREDIYWELRNWTLLWLNLKVLSSHLDISSSQQGPVPLGQARSHSVSHAFLSYFLSCSPESVMEPGVCRKVATSAHLEACQMASRILFFWLSGSFLQLKLLLSFVIPGIRRIFPIIYFPFIVLLHILLNCKLNLWKTEVWQWLALGISASKPHSVLLGCQCQGETLIESSGTPYEYDSFDLVEFQNLYFSVTLSTKRI